MYHPTVVDRRLSRLAAGIRQNIDPKFDFMEYSLSEVDEWIEELDKLYVPDGDKLLAQPNPTQDDFIRHELNRCKVDFLYWCMRYAKITDKNMSLVRLIPTSVQQLMLDRMAKAELEAVEGKTGDGIIFMVLKARQLGISTFSDVAIAHRTFFYGHTTALIAADTDARTPNYYSMVTRVLDNLPWWMKPRSADPTKDYRAKNQQISFADQDSVIRFSSSANMQGGDSGQVKGSMGTGMTLPLVHLSELALWKNPWQIDDALMPSIPMSLRTFAIFESTAKGRGNWWHHKWEDAKRGLGRRRPIFIPWYTDPDTYKLPAPTDWVPDQKTLQHAERVATTSERWVGKIITLNRNQMYWWERTRAEYAARNELHKFLAEYTSDDMESFQNTTIGVFPTECIADMREVGAARKPILIEIKPKLMMDREANA